MVIKAGLVAVVLLVGLAVLAFGLFLAWVALSTLLRDVGIWWESVRSRKWPSTGGTVTRSLVTRHAVGRRVSYTPRIVYGYAVHGESYAATRLGFASSWQGVLHTLDEATAWVERFPKGSVVTVLHDPIRPERSTIERRRSGFGVAFFFVVLLLAAAALVIPGGVHVLVGAFTDPPPFRDDELPPLSQQIGVLLVVVGGVSLLLGGVGSLRARRGGNWVRRLTATPCTPVADVKAGRALVVSGRTELSSEVPVVAPITGDPVVFFRVRVIAGGTVQAESTGHGDFYVRDEGGGRIRVITEGGTDAVPGRTLQNDAAVQGFVDDMFEGTPLHAPENYRVELAQIQPGDPVSVAGRPQRDRKTGGWVLTADPGDPASLVLSNASQPDLVRRATRRDRRNGVFLVVGAVAVVLGVAVL